MLYWRFLLPYFSSIFHLRLLIYTFHSFIYLDTCQIVPLSIQYWAITFPLKHLAGLIFKNLSATIFVIIEVWSFHQGLVAYIG